MRGKLQIMLVALCCTALQVIQAQTPVQENGFLKVKGNKIVDSVGNPVQLRGMSFFWSQWMGQFYTANTVKWLANDWKCTIVRAAMGIQKDGYATYPDAEKAKIETVIQAAIDAGIYVIIDWHSHTALDGTEPDQAAAFFTEMAKKYGKHPNIIYEPFNEPLKVSWTDLKKYHERIIDSIRKYDTTNIVVCGTPNWSQDVDAVIANPITAYKNVAYTLHYYAASHKEWLRGKAQQALDANLCLFVTEFGTCDASGGDPIDEESSNVWWDYLDANKISWCNWSVADKVEAASIVALGTSPDGNWTTDQITKSGTIVRTELLTHYLMKTATVDSKPIIVANLKNVAVGSGLSYKLSVLAFSIDPSLSYKWFFNGVEIKDVTANNYTVTAFDDSKVGKYSVVITNKNGAVNSDTASLTIIHRAPYKGVIGIPGTLQAENYDVGGNGFTYNDTDPAANQGKSYRTTEGVDIQESEEAGGYQVGWLSAGEWMEYTVKVAESGDYDLSAYVAAMEAGGVLTFAAGQTLTQFAIPSTSSWSKRTTLTKPISLLAGEQIIRLTIGGSKGFNIDKIEIKKHGEAPVNSVAFEDASVAYYPNPVSDMLTISTLQKTQVRICSETSVLDSFVVEGLFEYSCSHLPAGMYYLQYVSDEGIVTKKIVKQ